MKAAPSPPLRGSNVPFLKISFRKELGWPQSAAEAFPARLRGPCGRPGARPPPSRAPRAPGGKIARSLPSPRDKRSALWAWECPRCRPLIRKGRERYARAVVAVSLHESRDFENKTRGTYLWVRRCAREPVPAPAAAAVTRGAAQAGLPGSRQAAGVCSLRPPFPSAGGPCVQESPVGRKPTARRQKQASLSRQTVVFKKIMAKFQESEIME